STNLSHPEVHLKPGRFSRIWQHPCDLCCLAIARYKRTMRLHVKDALLSLLLCLLAMPAALAQDQELARGKQKQGRSNGAYQASREESDQEHRAQPLTLDEGLAILGAALDSRHHASRSDCSHFVHGLYARAGFPYAYARSSDLYSGIDEFRRVTYPQPGDLAVWRGHAGIVISPVQHSFFSLL